MFGKKKKIKKTIQKKPVKTVVEKGSLPVPTWHTKLELIQQTVAVGTTKEEFELFIYLAKQYNLDPLLKEIWCVKYKDDKPAAIFAGRDGFLKTAHNSGQLEGMKTFALTKDGREIPTCLDRKDLAGAICYVYRSGKKEPFVVAVNLQEYWKNQANWKTMPETMIKKVSQSQCLRMAFNIHGLYSPDEMPESMQTIKDITPKPKINPQNNKPKTDNRKWHNEIKTPKDVDAIIEKQKKEMDKYEKLKNEMPAHLKKWFLEYNYTRNMVYDICENLGLNKKEFSWTIIEDWQKKQDAENKEKTK